MDDAVSWLIPLARTLSIMLDKSGKSVFFLFFQLFSVEYVNCGLVIYGFSVLCSLYSHFVASCFFLNHRWILYFVKRFSASIEMILWFLFFSLVMWITWTDLQIWNHLCIPGINPTYLWCMILIMYCQVWLSNMLLKIFTSMFISDIGL